MPSLLSHIFSPGLLNLGVQIRCTQKRYTAVQRLCTKEDTFLVNWILLLSYVLN